MMFPDKVKITPIAFDSIYRKETPGVPFISEAAVEDSGEINFRLLVSQLILRFGFFFQEMFP